LLIGLTMAVSLKNFIHWSRMNSEVVANIILLSELYQS